METALHINDYKFHKSGKRRKYKDWRIDSYKILGKYMAAELPTIVLLLGLNW